MWTVCDVSGVSKRIWGHYALAHRISSLIEDDLIDMLTYKQYWVHLGTVDAFSYGLDGKLIIITVIRLDTI